MGTLLPVAWSVETFSVQPLLAPLPCEGSKRLASLGREAEILSHSGWLTMRGPPLGAGSMTLTQLGKAAESLSLGPVSLAHLGRVAGFLTTSGWVIFCSLQQGDRSMGPSSLWTSLGLVQPVGELTAVFPMFSCTSCPTLE